MGCSRKSVILSWGGHLWPPDWGFSWASPGTGAEEHTWYEPRRGVEEQVAV